MNPDPTPARVRRSAPPAWTDLALRAALSRMLTTKVEATPAQSGSYALPTRMARHVKAHDVTCTSPGCPKLARACQNDHITPWPARPTHLDNITSEYVQHHQSKTDKYVTGTRTKTAGPSGITGGGSVHWTTKNGHTLTCQPRPLLRG